jgi:hypothetical protein
MFLEDRSMVKVPVKPVKRGRGRPRTIPGKVTYFRFWLPNDVLEALDSIGPCRQKTIQRIIEQYLTEPAN